jgi:hypothetical protein
MSGQASNSTTPTETTTTSGGSSGANTAGIIGSTAGALGGASGSSMGSSIASGASLGTMIVPGWGTAIGAVVGAGAGLLQASQQAGAARKFQIEQDRAKAEAERQAGANFLKNVGVPLSGELAGMRANTAGYKQAIEAAVEGDWRNLPGVVGRADASMVDANAEQAIRIDEKLYRQHVAEAKEQKDSSNMLALLASKEAEGAGLAKQQAEKAKVAAYTSALQGVSKLGQMWDANRDLYPTQKMQANTPGYSEATDPLLNNIRSNTPINGPQVDTRGYSPIGERFPGVSQIDWSLF